MELKYVFKNGGMRWGPHRREFAGAGIWANGRGACERAETLPRLVGMEAGMPRG